MNAMTVSKPMKTLLSTVAAMLLLGAATQALASGDAARGKQKSVTCAACHGAEGNSASADFPRLAGQNEDYLAHVLAHYKGGVKRKNAIMMGMAAGLSEQDMADLAAWFASQPGLAVKY